MRSLVPCNHSQMKEWGTRIYSSLPCVLKKHEEADSQEKHDQGTAYMQTDSSQGCPVVMMADQCTHFIRESGECGERAQKACYDHQMDA